MNRRQSNRPDRRIAPNDSFAPTDIARIAKTARYVGSANHKRSPGDYGFVPPSSPRPSKALCDDRGSITLSEATKLFRSGIRKGMVSRCESDQMPKYVWAVDANGDVYEAKAKPDQEVSYHGYRLGDGERQMRANVSDEWNRR